jgi:hypothetical protein
MKGKHISRLFFMIVLMTLLIQNSFAQPAGKDAVYLRNGSIIRGKILGTIPGKSTRIETVGSNVLVLAETDIERIVMDEPVPPQERGELKQSGYMALADIGFLGGSGNNLSMMLTNLWQFKNRISTGAGFGIEKFDYQVIPVYADVRYNFLKGRITPFVFMQGGYSFPLGSANEQNNYQETELKGGGMLNPGVGLRINFNNRNAFVFSLGWRYQELHSTWKYTYWYYSQDDQSYNGINFYRRISIRVGFIFN